MRKLFSISKIWALVLLLSLISACNGGGGSSSGGGTPPPVNPGTAKLQSITITPANPVTHVGVNVQLTATGIFSDNSVHDITSSVTWSSSMHAVATISNGSGSIGVVTPVSAGVTNITANVGNISSPTVTLTVDSGTLQSIVVNPESTTTYVGVNVPFTAIGTFSDQSTQNITSSVTWSSSLASVATISNDNGSQGIALPLMAGTTNIRASLGDISSIPATLVVSVATLQSIAITPLTMTIPLGVDVQYIATGKFSDGNKKNITSEVTWISSNTGVATMSVATPGLATPVLAGTSNISASFENIVSTESATLIVKPASITLQSITITPTDPSTYLGTNVSFKATGKYSDGSIEDITSSVIWSSATPLIASISNASDSNGVATPLAAGSTKITASKGSVVSPSSSLTVMVNGDAYYMYDQSSQSGWPALNFAIYGVESTVSGVTLTSSVQPTINGSWSCFGLANNLFKMVTTQDSINKQYITTFTPYDGHKFDLTNPNCGYFVFSDAQNYSLVMRSELQRGGSTPISYASISGVSIKLASGGELKLQEKKNVISNIDPGHGKVLQGYYANWSIYNGMNFGPQKIPYNRLNTINYAFIYFEPTTGEIYAGDYNSDGNALPMIANAIRSYPYMKVYLSTGGWTNYINDKAVFADTLFDQLTTGANADAKMANFADTLVNAMVKLGFQGVNVDWEWWASTNPASNFTHDQGQRMINLYKALRARLDKQGVKDGKHYDLDIAVGAGKDKINAPEAVYPGYWNIVYNLVDHMGLMGYDMHGDWDIGQPAYFQAAWQMNQGNPYESGGYDDVTALNGYQSFISAKPLAKFQLGVPAYGRSIQVNSVATNGGLFQPGVASGVGQRSAEMSLWDYKCIINVSVCTQSGQNSHKFTLVNQYSTGSDLIAWNTYSKSSSFEPWAYGTAGGMNNLFVTYDDVYSVTQKTAKVQGMGLGGMMLWEIDGDADDDDNSLFVAMSKQLAK